MELVDGVEVKTDESRDRPGHREAGGRGGPWGRGVLTAVPAALTRREQLMSSRGSCIGYKGGRAGREAVHTLVSAHPS